MTYEEALKKLNEIKVAILAPRKCDSISEAEEVIKNSSDIDLIVKAVEKQIPKKPEAYADGIYVGYSCPNCHGKDYYHRDNVCEGDKCCSDCGQALDWGDEDG